MPLPEALRLVGAGVGDADIDDACRLASEDLAAGLSTAESRVCRDRLPAFKVPKVLSFLAALPRSGAGKVLKNDLAAQLTAKPHPE